MKKISVLIVVLIFYYNQASSQGCVAIRSTGGLCNAEALMEPGMEGHRGGNWLFTANNRYFKSFRHFVGKEEQHERLEKNTEVINYSYALDMTLVRMLSPRWSVLVNVPILNNVRSSLYEHDGKSRHTTKSFGLGDIRVAGYYWLIDPLKAKRGNVQAGLGIKLPTGDYQYQDFFHRDSTQVLGPVDQSIQLGDGGTGFTGEINAYYHINRTVTLYGNAYYLLNPREQNGVSTARGGKPTDTAIYYGTSTMSVPDQFMIRGGVNLNFKQVTISAGIRDEGIPAKDLVGGSSGFRRPGYVVSFEPGIIYNFRRASLYAFVPVAMVRNRTQSNSDIMRTENTGVYRQGDAAFADYSVNVGFSVRF